MKFGKRAVALALGAALALSLTACGSGANKEDASAKIQAALEKVNAVKNLDATMQMEMDLSIMGQKMETDTTMNMTCFNDPVKVKADMTMTMGSLGGISMSVYTDATDGNYTIYMYDGSSWTTQEADISQLGQYDAQKSMSIYLECGEDFALAGSEKINGATADKYSGVIRGEALEKVLASTAAAQSVESVSGELDLADLYSDLGDLPITVWVDRETGYPVRYYLAMTEMMQSILEKVMATAAEPGEADINGMVTINQVNITMDCYNFNNATEFEIPAEALAA